MTPFERYMKIKAELDGLCYDEAAMKQYLNIVQVVAEEDLAYNAHRHKMLQWLNTFERLEYNEAAMKQYLNLTQVLAAEEKAYKAHRRKMLEWLNTIEKTVYQSAERARE